MKSLHHVPSPAAPAATVPLGQARREPSLTLVRRVPPVFPFLTKTDPHVMQQLRRLGSELGDRPSAKQLCSAVYHRARALGYAATIGVHEVLSTHRGDDAGLLDRSTLLMIDLKPIPARRQPFPRAS